MTACVVCVPAKDEAKSLPALIAALDRQELAGRVRVVILANNCSDGTADVARAAARHIELRVEEVTLPPHRAHAGAARGLAMQAGATWLRGSGSTGVLVSTDADAVPPAHWIAATIRAIDAGAEVVGGAIRLPDRPLPEWLRHAHAEVARYWAAVRAVAERIDPVAHDPAPRHGDHSGASLAITLDSYEAAGGVPCIPSGEDSALVAEVERQGGRVRHAPDVWTTVSVREDGRAAGGMAAELRRWRTLAESGEPHLLPGAGYWQARSERRRALRLAFAANPAIAPDCVNDIAYVARVEPTLPDPTTPMQDIRAATAALEALAR